MPQKQVSINDKVLTLDARVDRLDLHDRPYLPRLRALPDQFPTDKQIVELLPKYRASGLILDQGSDGACTGYGLAAVINYLFFLKNLDNTSSLHPASPAMLFRLARLYDEWPGEDYAGSSCRGALRGWHQHGVCAHEYWQQDRSDPNAKALIAEGWDIDALSRTLGVYYRINTHSVVDMQAAINEIGAIYVSAQVHEGWSLKKNKAGLKGINDLLRIKHIAEPKQAGGHAFALVGYNAFGFVVQNSWGENWGTHGFALLPYEDWVVHGQDAWVFTLGASRTSACASGGKIKSSCQRSPSHIVPTQPLARVAKTTTLQGSGLVGASDGLELRYKDVSKHYLPIDADMAYEHSLILDRGFVYTTKLTSANALESITNTAYTAPKNWLTSQKSKKLLLYLHGGLNTEQKSIMRTRVMAPYALHHGIYPLFVAWRTGLPETMSSMVTDWAIKMGLSQPQEGGVLEKFVEGVTEKTDRLLESVLREAGSAMWGQMKIHAERASEHSNGGMRLLAEQLKRLSAEIKNLEIHVIAHSAGSILLGHMLDRLIGKKLALKSVRLMAPACSVQFAMRHYQPAENIKIIDREHWHIHNLSDKLELADNVAALYRKSLLYLVSRSFEDEHKTPLLGLDKVFDPSLAVASDNHWTTAQVPDLLQWQAYWQGLGIDETNRVAHTVDTPRMRTNGNASIASSHGGFDNDVTVMSEAFSYILNPNLSQTIKIERLDY